MRSRSPQGFAAPLRISARDLALIVVFAGLTAALGLLPAIPVPWSPAPITAQSLGIILAGSILGGWRGAVSQGLFLALVALGLPLLAGGRGGIGVFLGPTWGFLLGYMVVAGLVGLFVYRIGAPYVLWKGLSVNIVFGMGALYLFGLVGIVISAKLSFVAALAANVAYLPGDTLKCVLAALVAKGVHAAVPGMLPWRDSSRAPVER